MTLDTIKNASVKLCDDNHLVNNGTKKFVPEIKGLSKSFNFRDGILSFVDEQGSLYVTPLTNEFVLTLISAGFKWIRSIFVPYHKDITYSCDRYEEVFNS